LTAINNNNYSSSRPFTNIPLIESKWTHNTTNKNSNKLKINLLHGDYKNVKKVKNKFQTTNPNNNSESSNRNDEMLYKYEYTSKFFQNWDAMSTTRKKIPRAAILSKSYFNEKKASSPSSSHKITSIRMASAKKSSSNLSPFKMIIASSTPSFLITNFNFIPQTNVIEFTNTKDNFKLPLDENDKNFLTRNSTQINSRDVNYKPEVGIRIALMLGSLMCLIILYLLWRNRCHCLLHRFGLSVNNLKLISRT